MADKEQVQLLLGDLGQLVGISALALDAEDRCVLVVDGKLEIEITLVAEEDKLILAAALGQLPADAPPERYAMLLDANFFWRGTNGATLGVERESRTVVLLEAVPLAGLDVGRLEAALGEFVNVAEQWTGLLAAPLDGGDDAPPAREPQPRDFMLRA